MVFESIKRKYDAYPGWIFFPRLLSKVCSSEPQTTTDYLPEDWDILIILDACRYDVFEESIQDRANHGKLSSRWSPGSATPTWVRETFGNAGELHDTVYLDSNGNYANQIEGLNSELHAYLPQWSDKDGSREDANIVPPSRMAQSLAETAHNYPNKRIIAHFVQPHTPYLGENAEHIPDGPPVRDLVMDRQIPEEDVQKAYRENLDIALDAIEDILPELDGKVVVSADHGELLGERIRPIPVQDWGHPRRVKHPILRKVPWYEIEYEDRREILPEAPDVSAQSDYSESEIDEQLGALGYK